MIVARLVGGLGNQLFQYAAARRVALRNGVELLVDTSDFGPLPAGDLPVNYRRLALFDFRVRARAATQDELATFRATALDVTERSSRFHPAVLQLGAGVYLTGFWQSEKYFADIADSIREELRLKDATIEAAAHSWIAQLRQQFGEVTSLHVRRGDLVHAIEVWRDPYLVAGPPLDPEYYDRAMRAMNTEGAFVIFSDDLDWCRKQFKGSNIIYSAGRNELFDLVAMSYCDHHIVANSSFSWWGAWLNRNEAKRIIAPRTWFYTDRPDKKYLPSDDVRLDSWITM